MSSTTSIGAGAGAAKYLKPASLAAGLAVTALVLPVFGAAHAQATLQHLVRERGIEGLVMFLVLATGLTAIGLPRQIPAFVAGYAFGIWYGGAIALVSQIAACAMGFFWARAVGQGFVQRRFGPKLRRLEAVLAAQPFMTTLTLRLMPVGSNILLNLAAGLSSVRAAPFLAASALGFIPQTIVFAFIGRGSAPSHAHVLALGVALFVVSAAVGIVMLRRSQIATAAQA